MAKSKFTTEQLGVIARIVEAEGITRKSAIRKFTKNPSHYTVRNTKAAVATANEKAEPKPLMTPLRLARRGLLA